MQWTRRTLVFADSPTPRKSDAGETSFLFHKMSPTVRKFFVLTVKEFVKQLAIEFRLKTDSL